MLCFKHLSQVLGKQPGARDGMQPKSQLTLGICYASDKMLRHAYANSR